MGIVRIIVEKQVNTKQEGKNFAQDFLDSNTLTDKIRNFYVGDGMNVIVLYDDSQEFQKTDFNGG